MEESAPVDRDEASSRLKSDPSRLVRLVPIVAAMIYLNGTVLLLASGLWPWPINDPFRLYAFLVLAHLSLLGGYLSGAFRAPRSYSGRWSLRSVFWVCVGATLIVLPATSHARTGSWYPNIVSGLRNPGSAYTHALTLQASGEWIEYVRILLGVPLTLLLPLTVYFWKTLSKPMRVAAVVAIGGYLAIYVASGTNKALADAAVLISILGTAAVLGGRISFSRRHVLGVAGAGVAAIVFVLVFFSAGQSSRRGGLATSLDINTRAVNWNSPARPPDARYAALLARGDAFNPARYRVEHPDAGSPLVIAQLNNWLVVPLPERVGRSVIALAGYLTQGYYGLSLALQQPYVPTYGLGGSQFIARAGSRVVGSAKFEDRPYPMRVERNDGWDAYGLWSTFYAWVASDLTFPGVLLLMALIGRLLALGWLDTLEGSNPFAVGAFAMLVLMVVYLPANDQLLSSGESTVGFVGLLALWLWTRRATVPSTRQG
ncbi:MAG: hypothetical protein ABSG95_02105 [Solirubrobacteraceae bacterium]